MVSNNAVSSMVRLSTHRTGPSTEELKHMLVEKGMIATQIQHSFLSLRPKHNRPPRQPLIALSFIDLTEEKLKALSFKFNDMLGATLAMGPRKFIPILLPVGLTMRYELARSPRAREIAEKRLKDYAKMMGVNESAIMPLLDEKSVTIHRDGVDLVFKSWKEYLTCELDVCMETMKNKLLALFKAKNTDCLANQAQEIKDIINNTLKESSVNTSGFSEQILEEIAHAAILRALAFLSKNIPSLHIAYKHLCDTKGRELAKDGATILQGLDCKGDDLANTWAEALLYKTEETYAMTSFLAIQNNILLYCGGADVKVRPTDPLCIAANALTPANGSPTLETGNGYVPRGEREEVKEARRSAPVRIPVHPVANPNVQAASHQAYCLGLGIAALVSGGKTIAPHEIESLMAGINTVLPSNSPPYSHNESEHSSHKSSNTTSTRSSSANSSYSSDDEKEEGNQARNGMKKRK